MSRENVEEVVHSWGQAFNERDLDALEDLTSPDFEFVPYLASLVETTTYRGHVGLRDYFEDADAAWESVEVRVDEVREVGDLVVMLGELYGKGRASGLEVRLPLAWVGAVEAGKL